MQIAQVTAAAGFKVVAIDSTTQSVDKGMSMIRKSLETVHGKLVTKGVLTAEGAKERTDEVLARITTSTDRGALSDVDLVIEAVPETMEIKTPVYHDLTRICRPNAIIATNTSGLPVKAMADIAGRPRSVIGLHYFNPVQLMALTEVVKLDTTDAGVLATAIDFVKKQGKSPVVCEDTPGFIVNRLLVPFLGQSIGLVERGVAGVKDVDTAMELGSSHPMGPLKLADYVGLDTCCHILKNWSTMYPGEPAFAVPALLERMVAEGKLGRKSGEGFYKWQGNKVVS